MEGKFREAISDAIMLGYGFTKGAADERIIRSDELNSGADEQILEGMLRRGSVRLDVVDLPQDKHLYDMNVYWDPAEPRKCSVMLIFHGTICMDYAEEAIELYKETPLSRVLRIDDNISSEDDPLIFSYDIINTPLKDGLVMLFRFLGREECLQLIDVLLVDD